MVGGRSNGGLQHPRAMPPVEVEALLTMLAAGEQASPAAHRQTLNPRLFFLVWASAGRGVAGMRRMGRRSERKRSPVVLRVQEVQTLLSNLARTESLAGPARLPPSGFQAFLANSQRPLVIFSYQKNTAR